VSDRYDRPTWEGEAEDPVARTPTADDEAADAASAAPEGTAAPDATAAPDDTVLYSAEEARELLEEASENVLEPQGWPEPPAEPPGDVEDGTFVAAPAPSPGLAAPVGLVHAHHDDVSRPVGSEPEGGSAEHAPGELLVPPGFAVLEGFARGDRRAVGIVVARFNGDVTSRLLDSALNELELRGVATDAVTVMPVPGAFELPLAAMALAKTRRFACVVALGCVIRGDTPHFDYVCSEAASGLQLAAIETGVPVAFGVLTLDRADQAEARIGKGAEAVQTALEMADLFSNLRAAAAR